LVKHVTMAILNKGVDHWYIPPYWASKTLSEEEATFIVAYQMAVNALSSVAPGPRKKSGTKKKPGRKIVKKRTRKDFERRKTALVASGFSIRPDGKVTLTGTGQLRNERHRADNPGSTEEFNRLYRSAMRAPDKKAGEVDVRGTGDGPNRAPDSVRPGTAPTAIARRLESARKAAERQLAKRIEADRKKVEKQQKASLKRRTTKIKKAKSARARTAGKKRRR